MGFHPFHYIQMLNTAQMAPESANAFVGEAASALTAEEAHHIFGNNALAVTVLVIICLYFDYTIKRTSFFYLPESAASMLFGAIIGLGICWTSTPAQQVGWLVVTFLCVCFFASPR